ncbi:MAG: O-antigen ligase family protein [Terracidiphilus sp.]
MNETLNKPLYTLVLPWVLLFPLLFFVARGTFSFDRQVSGNLASSEANPVTDTRSGSTYYQFEQVFAYVVVLAVIVPSLPVLGSIIRNNLMIFMLPLFALLSTAWSESPRKTIPFSIFALILTIFGIYLSKRFSPDQQLDLFMFVGWASIGLSFVAVLLFPNAGIAQGDGHGAWRGMFIQKNVCGEITVLLAYAALFTSPKGSLRRIGLILFLLLASTVVIMSQSRTAWLLYISSALCYLLLRVFQSLGGREGLLLTVLIGVLLLALTVVAIGFTAQLAVTLGKDPTLTGRTKIWAAAAVAASKRPLLGYGYKAFWLGLKGESLNVALAVGATGLTNSENAMLETWLELGLVGVSIVLLTLFQASRNAMTCLRHGAPRYILWYILIIFFNLLALVDGEKIMFPHTIEWLLLVIAYAGLSNEARRVRGLRTV